MCVTMFMNGLDRFQHVLPVELPLQRVDCALAVPQPGVEVQASILHQHVDVAVCNLAGIKGTHIELCLNALD